MSFRKSSSIHFLDIWKKLRNYHLSRIEIVHALKISFFHIFFGRFHSISPIFPKLVIFSPKTAPYYTTYFFSFFQNKKISLINTMCHEKEETKCQIWKTIYGWTRIKQPNRHQYFPTFRISWKYFLLLTQKDQDAKKIQEYL